MPAANLGALGTIFGSLRGGVAPFGLFRGCPRVFGPFLDVGPCPYSPGDVLGCMCCFGQSGIDPQPFGSHSRGHFGVILGWFWCHLDHLRTLKCHVGLCWGHLGVSWKPTVSILRQTGAVSVHFELLWGRLCHSLIFWVNCSALWIHSEWFWGYSHVSGAIPGPFVSVWAHLTSAWVTLRRF